MGLRIQEHPVGLVDQVTQVVLEDLDLWAVLLDLNYPLPGILINLSNISFSYVFLKSQLNLYITNKDSTHYIQS